MKTDSIHTIAYKGLAFFCMVFSIVSCTLYMDDEPLREDLKGFDEVAEIETEFGKVEYQYKDSVYSLASNVLEYVQRIEHDSIIYYLESTPEEFIPKPGYYVSAHCSRKIPFGLNHMVLKVERTGGMIKVTTTHAPIERVYEHLNADLNIPVTFRSITGKDSLELEELGIDTTDLSLTDWTLFDQSTEADKEDRAEAKTRSGGSDDPWYTIIDTGDDAVEAEDGDIKLVLGNQTVGFGDHMVNDLFKLIEMYHSGTENVLFKNIKVEASAILNFHSTMHLRMCLNPVLETTIDLKMAPTLTTSLEMGFGGSPIDADLIRKTQLFRRNRCKDAFRKSQIKMPEIKFAIPYLSPAAVGVIKPRLTFGFGVWGMGHYSKKFYLDEIECHAKFIGTTLTSESTCKSRPSSNHENFIMSGMLNATASLSGGVGVGISVAGGNPQLMFNNDIVATLSASVEESSASQLNRFAYTPDNNRFSFETDYVLTFEAIAKVFSSIPEIDEFANRTETLEEDWFKDASISSEIFKGNIYHKYWYIRPGVHDFSVVSKQYNPADEKLKNFTVRLNINDNGIIDNYKKTGAHPFIAVRQLSKKGFRYYDADANGNKYSGIEEKNYDFYVDLDKYISDPEGYIIVPCISTVDGDTVQINGWDINLPADLKMVTFSQPDITQSYGAAFPELGSVKKMLVKNKYKNTADFIANPDKFYYYEFMTSYKLVGAANVQKWGLDMTVKNNVTGEENPLSFIIEDRSKKTFQSGKKNVVLGFLSGSDPAKSKDSKGPFTVTVEPFYYTTSMPKKKVYTGVTIAETLTYGMLWDDAFTDMDFVSVGL